MAWNKSIKRFDWSSIVIGIDASTQSAVPDFDGHKTS